MRTKDVIYVSNATTVDVAKALGFFNLIVSTVNNPIAAAQNILILKSYIGGVTPSIAVSPTVTLPAAGPL
jgi:polysaccharide export outer membrane protein